ncbi:serine hydrolase domain-containing protein [Lentzea albidocapillata]|uniref:D-alanyl-D-alanine carboxypeptidase n=1 Tax=Lentzea albidocapillata TaxID=40571 RepID=A0A1W2EA51_9PSEU|nr:serine hydrolase domain-containing protein [Lentzea albidocapillata]SMD06545.1 D-alanyl-D-alanine carboxypeptidase [Lentzea albidocapillata]
MIAVAALTALTLLVPQQLDQIVKDGTPGVEAHVNGHNHARGNAPVNGQVRIGSITKSFVAVATLQLVAGNGVELDKPVNRYVPHIKDSRITVRQVLQHTSGLPDYVMQVGVPKIADVRDRYFAPHDLLDVALSQTVRFQPGERYEYSNTNYVVAGLLIQKVTGRPVGEAIQKVITKAGLRDTYWPDQGEQRIRGRHAQAYALSDLLDPKSKVVNATELDTSAAWASGAMVSTPADVAKFYKTLLQGGLLAKPQLDEMRRTVAVDEKSAYGLGLESTKLSCGGVWWGHGGSIHGWASLGGATDGGRNAAITLTALPGTFGDDPAKKFQQVFDVMDTALCKKK